MMNINLQIINKAHMLRVLVNTPQVIIKRKTNNGPTTDPCGTPVPILPHSDISLSVSTRACILSYRYQANYLRTEPDESIDLSLRS